MAQQTAVEWLKDMLEWNYGDTQMLKIEWKNLDDLIKRAKQMEKEQMCKFAYKCHNHYKVNGDFKIEQYYNETYGKENNND